MSPETGFDKQCPSNNLDKKKVKVAAIVNWSGITDVEDLIAGDNKRNYAVERQIYATIKEFLIKHQFI